MAPKIECATGRYEKSLPTFEYYFDANGQPHFKDFYVDENHKADSAVAYDTIYACTEVEDNDVQAAFDKLKGILEGKATNGWRLANIEYSITCLGTDTAYVSKVKDSIVGSFDSVKEYWNQHCDRK